MLPNCLVFLLLFATLTVDAYNSCNLDKLTKCLNKFNSQLNIEDPFSWDNIAKLQQTVEEKYLADQFETCRGFTNFGFCFSGEANYQACTHSVMSLVIDQNKQQTTVDVIAARHYVKFIAQLAFACGSGFGLYHSFPKAIKSVFANNRTALAHCDAMLSVEVNPNPNTACSNAKKVIDCYQKVFSEQGGEAGWWGCSYARYGILRGMVPHCNQIVCTGFGGNREGID